MVPIKYSLYLVQGKRGKIDLTAAFYQLSLKAKIKVIDEMTADGLLSDVDAGGYVKINESLSYRLASALLQHDNPKTIGKQNPAFIEIYPNSTAVFSGIRKLNKQAREADAADRESDSK